MSDKYLFSQLSAATAAAEILDFELSQAILDGANISVPNGYLTECYDELGKSLVSVFVFIIDHFVLRNAIQSTDLLSK
jgi:Ubiquitin-binding domain